MPFLLGAISGVLLTVLAVFAADAVTTAADPSKDPQQRIVNWDVAPRDYPKPHKRFVKALTIFGRGFMS